MGGGSYYNEFDPFAAQWIREMVKLGVLPPGEVDGRSIKDVTPDDLRGFTQCHFFAGIGGWAYAARLAGWPDDRPLWTGSCPCQPFSTAGRGRGHDDPRDLWPHFLRLIRARRPAVVVGEQVAGKAGFGWLDRVRADLAREDYAGRGVDIPACAVDAPHIRQRIYWVALADAERLGLGGRAGEPGRDFGDGYAARRGEGADRSAERHAGGSMVDASGERWGEGRTERPVRSGGDAPADPDAPRHLADAGRERGRTGPGYAEDRDERSDLHGACDMADADVVVIRGQSPAGQFAVDEQDAGTGLWAGSRHDDLGDARGQGLAFGPVAEVGRGAVWDQGSAPGAPDHRDRRPSFWSDAEWLICHDGKARRTQPGLPLLAHGVSSRVPKWRGLGNAINPVLAAEVLGALLDVLPDDGPVRMVAA